MGVFASLVKGLNIEVELFLLRVILGHHITRWGNSYLVMHDLWRKIVGMPILLEYCH